MTRRLHVHLLPFLLPAPDTLRQATAVVIDLLRASTSITCALAAGAARVIPVLTVEDALRLRHEIRGQRVILAGEREGVRIDGFDLGNSPGEFVPGSVGGATLVFTTTNGTRAILAARTAHRVLVGCFANIDALERQLVGGKDVHMVCAGTNGEPSLEDTLFAGAIGDRLVARGFLIANDQAYLALENWKSVSQRPGGLLSALRESRGGKNLASIDLASDIDECARFDTCDVVPELQGDELVPSTPAGTTTT